MKDLKEWINGKRDYKAGLSLYRKYGNDSDLLRVLTGKKDPKSLERQLLALYKPTQAAAAKPVVTKATPVKRVSVIDQVKALDEQAKTHWKQMDFCCAQLQQTRNAEVRKRFRLAETIVDLDAKCKLLYHDIDHYKLHGKLPLREAPIAVDQTTDLHGMLKRLRALDSQIHYRRKKIENTKPGHRSIAAHKIALHHNLKEREELKAQYEANKVAG